MPTSVFVLEDASDLRLLYRLSLTRAGFVLAGEASSLAQAREALAELRPDVVLVDLTLDDASGQVIVDQVRELAPHAVLVVCSGDESAVVQGADVMFPKTGSFDVGQSLSGHLAGLVR